jgi:hypothetical protein
MQHPYLVYLNVFGVLLFLGGSNATPSLVYPKVFGVLLFLAGSSVTPMPRGSNVTRRRPKKSCRPQKGPWIFRFKPLRICGYRSTKWNHAHIKVEPACWDHQGDHCIITIMMRCIIFVLLASSNAFSTSRIRVPRKSVLKAESPKPPKWNVELDEFAERINSAKAALAGAVVGSLIFAPIDLAWNFQNIPQVRGIRCYREAPALGCNACLVGLRVRW